MRDLFDQLSSTAPLDPTEAARRNMRPQARQRFYTQAGIGEDFSVLLDGKPVKTPARRPLKTPNAALAQAIAGEWRAQREVVDSAAMPLTRLANAIIDGVADAPADVAREIEKYLGSDLVFYRAEAPEGLVARQTQLWDPMIAFARDVLGARFVLAQGVVHAAQPREAVAAAAKAIPTPPSLEGIWRLGAIVALTTLTGSALIALALAAGKINADEAWAAAHVDEDWNMASWGRDDAALARRAARFAEFAAAALVLREV